MSRIMDVTPKWTEKALKQWNESEQSKKLINDYEIIRAFLTGIGKPAEGYLDRVSYMFVTAMTMSLNDFLQKQYSKLTKQHSSGTRRKR